jgi:hypothetical protein
VTLENYCVGSNKILCDTKYDRHKFSLFQWGLWETQFYRSFIFIIATFKFVIYFPEIPASFRTKFWLESLKGSDHWEDLVVDGRIILNGSYGNVVGRCELDLSG